MVDSVEYLAKVYQSLLIKIYSYTGIIVYLWDLFTIISVIKV